MPAPNWQCLRSAGPLPSLCRQHHRHFQYLGPRGRRGQPSHIPLLSNLRFHGLLRRRRLRRRIRSNPCGRFRGSKVPVAHLLGVRGAHAFLGAHARGHGTHALVTPERRRLTLRSSQGPPRAWHLGRDPLQVYARTIGDRPRFIRTIETPPTKSPPLGRVIQRAVGWTKRSVPTRFFNRVRRIHPFRPPSSPNLVRLTPAFLDIEARKAICHRPEGYPRRMQKGALCNPRGHAALCAPYNSLAWPPRKQDLSRKLIGGRPRFSVVLQRLLLN